ncbi:MAG: hypothetical protein NC343_01265 [Muribaculum sp.]|nr:hypothetical protein [Muribaculaceae bacterium]MCM1080365.1 hypothetical protein [Muribaculum sp.]
MKKLFLVLMAAITAFGSYAQSFSATWTLSDPDNLNKTSLVGDEVIVSNLSTGFALGDKMTNKRQLTSAEVETGKNPVNYEPPFTVYKPAERVTTKTDGHCLTMTLTPAAGHLFCPASLEFDAVKVGTNAGSFDVYYRIGEGEDVAVATNISPSRDKVTVSVPDGCSHHKFELDNIKIEDGQTLTVTIYPMKVPVDKEMGFRNVTIAGNLDENLYVSDLYIKSITCSGATTRGGAAVTHDLTAASKSLGNGGTGSYSTRIFGEPTNIKVETIEGYTATATFNRPMIDVTIFNGNVKFMSFSIRMKVTSLSSKPKATPLKRGLMALSLTGAKMGTGNLVSWRHREADGYGVKYKLYRGDEQEQSTLLNDGLYIIDRTNFLDEDGAADNFYRLETYDATGKLLETEVSKQTWASQTLYIPTEAPTDKYHNAYYSPNDASYCDMDGDGEYEIILKWYPDNAKDSASSGTTSPAIYDCLKLDGTRLWRIDAGPNMFCGAHTTPFIAWDLDGDGYGEFMIKTAPGTIDGEGNYVLLDTDDPAANLLNSNGKQVSGSEYITVFDGMTGAELATIPYHTDYKTGQSVWGDNYQNRSERYLSALAYLDGPDANPSPIFARGYYSGAFVAAYDWDGVTLKERWVSRNATKGQGLWGEGAHWISVGDCDGDGKHEIVYGSSALDDDGSLLYRTGLGHGDALHLFDLLPERPGMELFMVHEESPYGYDLRDAATGKLILHVTADGDTGRGIAAHFDSSYNRSQFLYSASAGVHDCLDGSMIAEKWAIGSSGAGINNRIYWDGDLYDEFYDKSIIAHWNHENAWFDRYQVNGGMYTIGNLNNGSKYNPCVLGDLLGDWREEIVTWDGGTKHLIINATSFTTDYRIPHLMDDLNYRVQVVNQNCGYNQPPHLSCDPSVKYTGNPNVASQDDITSGIDSIEADTNNGPDVIYNIQGIRIDKITSPGLYIKNGKKIMVR